MKRTTLINLISASGLLGVAYALTPAGWDTDQKTRLVSTLLICPALILIIVLFVLAHIDQGTWSVISFFTNLMLGVIALAAISGMFL